MKKRMKIVIPVVAGFLAVSAGIGAVAVNASNQNEVYRPNYQAVSTNATPGGAGMWHCGGLGGMMGYGVGQVTSQVATLLGTTAADLKSQLNAGKTLADIASAKGVKQDQLIQTIMAPYKEHLDIMVKYGYLTQDQVNTFVQQAQERLQTIVTSPLNADNDWWDYMGGMMYGWGNSQQQPGTSGVSPAPYGGMMNGWGYSQPQPGTNPVPQRGFGGMMGGSGRGMMGRW